MNQTKLPTPTTLKARFNSLSKDWDQELAGILKAYQWAYGGLWEQQERDPKQEKVKTSSVSRPTQNAALYAVNRKRAEQAIWKVECVLSDLKAAREQMDKSVGPLNLGVEAPLGLDARQGIFKEGSRKARAQYEKSLEAQQKRRANGF